MKKIILPGAFCLGLVTISSMVTAKPNYSLEKMIAQGLANNLELRQAQFELETAQKIAKQNQRFASIIGDANLNYTQNHTPDDQTSEKNSNFEVSIVSGALDAGSANWSLSFNHYKDELENSSDTYSLKCAPFKLDQKINTFETRLSLANSQSTYQTTRLETISKIRIIYAECYQKSNLLKLAKENLQLAKNYSKLNNSLFKAGKISYLELQISEQEERTTTNQLQIAEINYEAALNKLKFVTGANYLTYDQSWNPETLNWANSNQINLNATLVNMKQESPDLKIAQLELQIAKFKLQQASLCQLAGLELGVSHFVPKDTDFINKKTTYSLELSGSLDDLIFRNISQQKSTVASSTEKLELITKKQEAKLLESFQNWRLIELSLEPLQENLDQAKKHLQIISIKLKKGMSDDLEVLEAYQRLAEVETNYWQTWFELIQAREDFYQSCYGNPVLNRD